MDGPKENPQGDRLRLLVHMTQAFNSSLDLDEVLNRVMDEVIVAMHAERGFVVLTDDSGKIDIHCARGLDQQTIEDPQFQISRSVIERVIREGKPVLTSDAQNDERFNIRESIMFLKLRAILGVPLTHKDKVTGAIYVDNRLQAGIFTREDIEMLEAIASSAAIAIENARLYQVAVEKGRMEREMQMARKVQSGLLPQSIPQIEGWEFATLWKPARQVGGDYYDFIPVRGGKTGLVIADVTDKGLGAALFMASTRSVLRASVPMAASPAEGIRSANALISDESRDVLFVTLLYAQIDPAEGTFTYVNAGHNPPLLFHQKDGPGSLSLLEVSGMALGVDEEASYEQYEVQLQPGDFVLLYTDGVTDAQGADGVEYGLERLKRVVMENSSTSPDQLLSAIQAEIENFTGGAAPFDDLTMIAARKTA